MYKNIVPDLISLETDLNLLRGSYLFRNLNFYPQTKRKNPFHYKLVVQKDLQIPQKYSFRNGYYFKHGNMWYYQRHLFGLISFKFKYDPKAKTFYCNKIYQLLPFEIGGILPLGKHIADLINLELFLENFDIHRGFAYKYKQKVICNIASSFIGKTTLMKKIIDNGHKYIAEDIVILGSNGSKVYPTSVINKNYGRKVNNQLHSKVKKSLVSGVQPVHEINLLRNTTNNDSITNIRSSHFDYYFLSSLMFLDNKLIRSYIFAHGLSEKLQQRLQKLKDSPPRARNLIIKNYQFDQLDGISEDVNENKNHWEELGKNYSKVWQPKSKQYMSTRELSFLNKYSQKQNIDNVLDCGIGNGRIIKNYLKNLNGSSIYGIDMADEMVRICKREFKSDKRVKKLAVCNISKQDVPFDRKFDFISAVRVLKYNKNWPEIIKKIVNQLDSDGIFVFSLPNRNSLNRFSSYKIPSYKTTRKEIKKLLQDMNIELVEITSFTKLPDVLYELNSNLIYQHFIVLTEKFLQFLFGGKLWGREFFVSVKKPASVLSVSDQSELENARS